MTCLLSYFVVGSAGFVLGFIITVLAVATLIAISEGNRR